MTSLDEQCGSPSRKRRAPDGSTGSGVWTDGLLWVYFVEVMARLSTVSGAWCRPHLNAVSVPYEPVENAIGQRGIRRMAGFPKGDAPPRGRQTLPVSCRRIKPNSRPTRRPGTEYDKPWVRHPTRGNMTSRQLHIIHALAASVIALASGVSAQAAASRTFVSTTGNDANTSVNCSPTAPCRMFTAALSVTNSGGEIVVLSSGGYGPATISQPVIITAIGVDASISAMSGGNGITINTNGNVTLIGLNLHGEGIGLNGVEVQQGASIRLYNMLIENFTKNGVDFEVSGKLLISGSSINSNAGTAGLFVVNAAASAYVQGTSFNGNTNGVIIGNGQVTVADSSAEYNGTGFGANGTLTLINDRAVFNDTGLEAFTGGSLYFANCLIANNDFSYQIVAGATMAGSSPGTSFIAPGQSTTGSLSTAITLR